MKDRKNKKIIIAIIVIAIIIIIALIFKDNILKIMYPKNYKEIISIYTERYEVEENLIYAVIKAESDFDANAVSSRNAIGLMQLMEKTAKDVALKNNISINYENIKEELKNSRKNIEIGTCYLANLMQRYNNKEVALAAYNAGIGTVDKWIENGIIKQDGTDIENVPYKETNNYIRKILRDYKIYETLYKN